MSFSDSCGNLLDRYPRQIGLFIVFVALLAALLFSALRLGGTSTITIMLLTALSNVIGGLIADLTGRQHGGQEIDARGARSVEVTEQK